MKTIIEPTYWVRIYLSGPLAVIEQACRRFCLVLPRCVTVDPTRFIYEGGEEMGAVVGLINYPRFPSTEAELIAIARRLALELLEATAQHSVLIMSPHETEWITKREGKNDHCPSVGVTEKP